MSDQNQAGKSRIPGYLSQATDHLAKQHAMKRDEEQVTIVLGEAYERYFRRYYSRLEAAYRRELPFSYDEFRGYMERLIDSRVKWVNQNYGGPRPSVRYNARVPVPVVLHDALSSIGRVSLDEVGVLLIPEFVPSTLMLPVPEFLRVATLMQEVVDYAKIEVAPQAYTQDERGMADLMVLQALQSALINGREVSGVVAHNEKGALALAPIAWMLGLRQMQGFLGPRVIYGRDDELDLAIDLLVAI